MRLLQSITDIHTGLPGLGSCKLDSGQTEVQTEVKVYSSRLVSGQDTRRYKVGLVDGDQVTEILLWG